MYYSYYGHASGPALPGISCSSVRRVVPGYIEVTHHANVVPVEERLRKLCLLPALRCGLAVRIQLGWSLSRVSGMHALFRHILQDHV